MNLSIVSKVIQEWIFKKLKFRFEMKYTASLVFISFLKKMYQTHMRYIQNWGFQTGEAP